MPDDSDNAKLAELTAIVQAVRERVRARYPEPDGHPPEETNGIPKRTVHVPVADLMPVVHARDAAQAKIAAIGSVNPRRGGAVNNLIQSIKKTIARSLQWFVRDQITFNREAVSAMEAMIEALNDHNRILLSLAGQTSDQLQSLEAEHRDLALGLDRLSGDVQTGARELNDNEYRTGVFSSTTTEGCAV